MIGVCVRSWTSPDSREVFAGVDIAGGVSYFLWDSSWDGACDVTTVSGGVAGQTMSRLLDEYDILVRYNEAVSILHRVLATSRRSPRSRVSRAGSAPIQPFSIRTNFRGAAERVGDGPSQCFSTRRAERAGSSGRPSRGTPSG